MAAIYKRVLCRSSAVPQMREHTGARGGYARRQQQRQRPGRHRGRGRRRGWRGRPGPGRLRWLQAAATRGTGPCGARPAVARLVLQVPHLRHCAPRRVHGKVSAIAIIDPTFFSLP